MPRKIWFPGLDGFKWCLAGGDDDGDSQGGGSDGGESSDEGGFAGLGDHDFEDDDGFSSFSGLCRCASVPSCTTLPVPDTPKPRRSSSPLSLLRRTNPGPRVPSGRCWQQQNSQAWQIFFYTYHTLYQVRILTSCSFSFNDTIICIA